MKLNFFFAALAAGVASSSSPLLRAANKFQLSGLSSSNSTRTNSPPPDYISAHLTNEVVARFKHAARIVRPEELPLQTNGRWIIDKNGRRVKLACVAWTGAEGKGGVVDGLQYQHANNIARTISRLGFNCVRLPFSIELVHYSPRVNANAVTMNPELVRQTSFDREPVTALAGLDHVIKACSAFNLMVILDNHGSQGGRSEDSWYSHKWPERSWAESLLTLAKRYERVPYVVGIELRNAVNVERGHSAERTWAAWAYAVELMGNQILDHRPNGLLVVVPGLEESTDFSFAQRRPITLSIPNRLVFSYTFNFRFNDF